MQLSRRARARTSKGRIYILPCSFQPRQQMNRVPNMRPAALPRGLILAKHGCGRRPPRTYDHVRQFYCAFCIIFSCTFRIIFSCTFCTFRIISSSQPFLHRKSARASCPGAWLPYQKLIQFSEMSRRGNFHTKFPRFYPGGILENSSHINKTM